MCVCHCIFSIFIKNLFAVINCTRLKYTYTCIILFFSLPDSWDSLAMAIGSNTTMLSIYDVVLSLLSKEMR
jgi:hypothetical protein